MGFNLPVVTKNLIIINVLLYLACIAIPSLAAPLTGYYFENPLFKPWQIVTHMFMHGSPGHLLMNMLGLLMIGKDLESYWGPKKFLNYYLICGLGAFGLHEFVTYIEVTKYASQLPIDFVNLVKLEGREALLDNKNFINTDAANLNGAFNSGIVGASGCVFGLLVAFGLMFPKASLILFPLPFPIQARTFGIGYAVIELFLAYADRPSDNVAHFAHLGGLLFGYIILKIWQKQGKLYS